MFENELVKKYLELCNENDSLKMQEEILYSRIKHYEYVSCNHIWINLTKYCGHTFNGCIKCGANSRILNLGDNFGLKNLTEDEKIMYYFLKRNLTIIGTYPLYSPVICNLDLARAIYKKIKEAHPDIDDVTATKYFEIALDNIRNIEVSKERKKSRAKRLSLTPDFNKWNN